MFHSNCQAVGIFCGFAKRSLTQFQKPCYCCLQLAILTPKTRLMMRPSSRLKWWHCVGYPRIPLNRLKWNHPPRRSGLKSLTCWLRDLLTIIDRQVCRLADGVFLCQVCNKVASRSVLNILLKMLRRLRKAAFMKPFLVGEDDVMIQFLCQACTESTFAKSESDFETPRVTTYGQKKSEHGAVVQFLDGQNLEFWGRNWDQV